MISYVKSILLLTKLNLILQGKLSTFGIIWSFFSPILFIIIYSFAFKKIFNVEIDNFPLFVTSVLLPWLFFVSSISESSNSFINNRHILVNMPVNIFKFLLSSIFSNYFTFFIHQLTLITIIIILYKYTSIISVLYLILLNITFFIFIVNISIFVSTVKVYFKNISSIIDMLFNALIFISPVFYGRDMLPKEYDFLIYLNPLFFFFEEFRKVFYFNKINLLNQELLYILLFNIILFIVLVKFLKIIKYKILEVI